MIVLPAPLIVPLDQVRAAVSVRSPAPVRVPPAMENAALICDATATDSVPPLRFKASSLRRLLMDCVPEEMTIVGFATTDMVTSSAGPGREGLLDQFPGVVHWLSPARPVQLTAL